MYMAIIQKEIAREKIACNLLLEQGYTISTGIWVWTR